MLLRMGGEMVEKRLRGNRRLGMGKKVARDTWAASDVFVQGCSSAQE